MEIPRHWGQGNEELLFNRYRASDEKVLEMNDGDGWTAMQLYLMTLNCTLIKG